ncbi:hypothetical protein HK101_010533 [Irineochytrium annulatum]|nr:hypothetical protein HK101_010533 [Irineochytrium annulatum]
MPDVEIEGVAPSRLPPNFVETLERMVQQPLSPEPQKEPPPRNIQAMQRNRFLNMSARSGGRGAAAPAAMPGVLVDRRAGAVGKPGVPVPALTNQQPRQQQGANHTQQPRPRQQAMANPKQQQQQPSQSRPHLRAGSCNEPLRPPPYPINNTDRPDGHSHQHQPLPLAGMPHSRSLSHSHLSSFASPHEHQLPQAAEPQCAATTTTPTKGWAKKTKRRPMPPPAVYAGGETKGDGIDPRIRNLPAGGMGTSDRSFAGGMFEFGGVAEAEMGEVKVQEGSTIWNVAGRIGGKLLEGMEFLGNKIAYGLGITQSRFEMYLDDCEEYADFSEMDLALERGDVTATELRAALEADGITQASAAMHSRARKCSAPTFDVARVTRLVRDTDCASIV